MGYCIKWGYKNDPKQGGYHCPDSESLTLPIAQAKRGALQARYPGLQHWIVDIETGEVVT